MSTEEFIDYLIEEFESSGHEEEREDIAVFWKEVMTYYSDSMLKSSLNKKNAARVLYTFCNTVKHLPKVSWKTAGKLKDIYECRVCAEAIAQVFERGIIKSRNENIFGINDTMTDKEAHTAVAEVRKIHIES